jgi:hypothetical protein
MYGVEIKATDRTTMTGVAKDQRFTDAGYASQLMKPRKKIYVLGIINNFCWVPQGKFAVLHTTAKKNLQRGTRTSNTGTTTKSESESPVSAC